MTPGLLIAIPVVAGALCAALIAMLLPMLQRHALARPNARSSHTLPTPQGGGIAVIVATIAVTLAGLTLSGPQPDMLLPVIGAAAALALVGAFDDLKPIPVLHRLIVQVIAVGIVVAILPDQVRFAPAIPFWVERALLLVGGMWFVNLVNFMDGLDWMTAAEVVPVTAALALFGVSGQLAPTPTLVALALLGAMIGFAPFNKPVAKLFLGDAGSLPIGLLIGWLLLQLAAGGHLVAALLLPLYYLADATVTLLRRLINGEAVWVAHRSHFYQRATNNGFSVMQISGEVFVLNIVLAALAAVSIWLTSPYIGGMTLALGVGAVALVLNRFSRPREALP